MGPKQQFIQKFLEYVENEDISHVDLEERLIDFISEVLEEADVDLIPEADMMVSYYDEKGFVENGFITKEAQREKFNKLREEKRQIQLQRKLIIDNEKQVRKNEEKRRKIEEKRIKIEQQKIKDEEATKLLDEEPLNMA